MNEASEGVAVFSCRAECWDDICKALGAIADAGGKLVNVTVGAVDSLAQWLPDRHVEFYSNLDYDTLRKIMGRIDDCHVMMETLRGVDRARNHMLRTYGRTR